MPSSQDVTDAPITIVIACFGSVFERGLSELLGDERDFRVLHCGLELSELEAAIARESPHIAILGERALASTSILRRIRTVQPNIGLVVLLHGLSEYGGRQLLAFGATACVAQDAPWSDISAAIRFAADGKQLVVSVVSRVKPSGHLSMTLTQREREVLLLLQEGRSNPQIADMLQIGNETVRSHVQRVYRKLGVKRRSDLVPIDQAEPLA